VSVPALPELLVSHWELTPSLIVASAASAGVYLWGTTRVRGRWPVRRTLAFLAGVGGVLVALQSGLDSYDDVLLSAHMLQHLILLLGAPLLLLWGRPVVLALRALPAAGRRRLAGTTARITPLTHWVTGLVVFYAVVLGTAVPAVFDATLRHPWLHDCEHIVLLVAGVIFLWPLYGHPASSRSLGSLGSLCYVIASMPSCALVGSYLDRYPATLYEPYVHADRLLGISALTQQQQAGALMWVGAHLILTAVALWVLGAKLVAEERRQQVRDAIESRGPLASGPGQGPALP
jgi:putative membrane protein